MSTVWLAHRDVKGHAGGGGKEPGKPQKQVFYLAFQINIQISGNFLSCNFDAMRQLKVVLSIYLCESQ